MLREIEEARTLVRELEEASRESAKAAEEAKAKIVAAANAAIDEVIRASGLTYGDILGAPVPEIPATKQARKRGSGEHPRYALIGDPDCTYARGPVPLWMKKEMDQAGLDPASKADRETFRATRMVQV